MSNSHNYNTRGDDSPSPLDHLDFELDPILRESEHRKSTKEAMVYLALVPILTFISGFAVANFSRSIGGPLCDAGEAAWLCSRTAQILFFVIPSALSGIALISAGIITYLKWKHHNRWQPWFAVVWMLIIFTLFWFTSTGTLAITGR